MPNKKYFGIIFMIVSALCSCTGQLFWKLFAMNNNLGVVIIGFLLYGIGAIFMVVAYRFGSLSVLQPILSLSFIISIVMGALILQEKITIFKCTGIIFIVIGVTFIANGEEE